MKGLICFWGLNRGDLKLVKDNLLAQFPEIEFEVLLSTWSDQVFDLEVNYKLLHQPPTIDYLNQINFPFTRQIIHNTEWHGFRLSHYAQFFHNYSIVKFIKDMNLKYDVLIKSRADLILSPVTPIDFNSDVCWVPEIYWASRGVGINDHFVCGKFDYVLKALNIDDFQEFFPVIQTSWNPETVNQRLILENNCQIIEFPCDNYTLLPDKKLV